MKQAPKDARKRGRQERVEFGRMKEKMYSQNLRICGFLQARSYRAGSADLRTGFQIFRVDILTRTRTVRNIESYPKNTK